MIFLRISLPWDKSNNRVLECWAGRLKTFLGLLIGFSSSEVIDTTKPTFDWLFFFFFYNKLRDIIRLNNFFASVIRNTDRDILGAIFEVTLEMEKTEKNSPGSQILKGYLMATLFYEPSTRTRLSFESVMKRLVRGSFDN